MPSLSQQKTPIEIARDEIEGAYESAGYWIGTKIENVRELNGRIYFDKWERRPVGGYQVYVHRFDGAGERDEWVTSTGPNGDGYMARPYVDSEEVAYVHPVTGDTEWFDDDAEADHKGEK